jgi:hypothetical protein
MQRKTAFLVCAMAALLGFNNANAISYGGEIRGGQTHSPHGESGTFEVKSADGNYRLGLNALLQTGLNYVYNKPGVDKGKNKLNFELHRARVGFHGNAFDPALTYLFQMQFAERGEVKLIDYSTNWAVSQEYFHVAVGKFALPFARQLVMSPAKYQFINALDNPSYANYETLDLPQYRSVGVMFHSGYNNPLEYALAITQSGVTARLGFNYNGIDGYDAVDFVGGDLRFGVAASAHLPRSLLSPKFNTAYASADFILKAHGFSTNGVVYYKWDSKTSTDIKNSFGAGIDLGYLINQTWEPVVRYAWQKPGDDNNHDFTLGLNHYCFGHNLKTQLYAGTSLIREKINPIKAGLQVQFAL